MIGPFLEGLLVLVLILCNGLLAMAEIAIVSVRPARLSRRAEAGDKNAEMALHLAREPADFLSTVQIGITLVGVLTGAISGATIASRLAVALELVPLLEPYSHFLSLGAVVVLITYLTLILGELAPKRLALNDAERIATSIAAPMHRLSNIASPVVRILSSSTDLVLRVLGVRPGTEPPVTEDEIKVMIEMGTRAGVFQEAEQDMISRVLRLADRRVGTLMTPRTEIACLDLEDLPEVTRRKVIESLHSRLPVTAGDLDHIQGVVQAKELLSRCIAGEPVDLKASMHPPQFIPESTPALKVLETFRKSGVHIALVIDEFGGLQGLVTIIDILEAIVGDIPAQDQLDEPEIVRRDDGSWLIDGMLPFDEFVDLMRISQPPEENQRYFETLGGFVMARLGRIPQAGDAFYWAGYQFEVVDMDGFRVDKVLVDPNV